MLNTIALALALLPKAMAQAVSSEDIPLAVAFGLELVLVIAVDWQQAVHRSLAHEDPLRRPLIHGQSTGCKI